MLREMHIVADTRRAKEDAKEEGTLPRPGNLKRFSGHASAPHRTPEPPISSMPPAQA